MNNEHNSSVGGMGIPQGLGSGLFLLVLLVLFGMFHVLIERLQPSPPDRGALGVPAPGAVQT